MEDVEAVKGHSLADRYHHRDRDRSLGLLACSDHNLTLSDQLCQKVTDVDLGLPPDLAVASYGER